MNSQQLSNSASQTTDTIDSYQTSKSTDQPTLPMPMDSHQIARAALLGITLFSYSPNPFSQAGPQPLKAFKYFPLLPPELQLIIWEFANAFTPPNIVTITEPPTYMVEHDMIPVTDPPTLCIPYTDHMHNIFQAKYRIPPLLHTTHASRSVALKTHPKAYASHLGYSPTSTSKDDGIFFNFNTDALRFLSIRCMRRFFNFSYIGTSMVRDILQRRRGELKPEKRLRYLLYGEDETYHLCVGCFGNKLVDMGGPELVVCLKRAWVNRPYTVMDFERGGQFVRAPKVVQLKDDDTFGLERVEMQRDVVKMEGEEVVLASMTMQTAKVYLRLLSQNKAVFAETEVPDVAASDP